MKKRTSAVALLIALASVLTISVAAAREQGAIGDPNNPSAGYDYQLKKPILPWNDVNGYSSTSYLVDYTVIQSGFTAYSYIEINSNDGLANAQKTGYVTKGTNNADTGTVSISGYNKDCNSSHASSYPAEGVYYSANLGV